MTSSPFVANVPAGWNCRSSSERGSVNSQRKIAPCSISEIQGNYGWLDPRRPSAAGLPRNTPRTHDGQGNGRCIGTATIISVTLCRRRTPASPPSRTMSPSPSYKKSSTGVSGYRRERHQLGKASPSPYPHFWRGRGASDAHPLDGPLPFVSGSGSGPGTP